MKYRKLRIAWSVAWAVMAVLLIALWMRSYRRNDILSKVDPGDEVTTFGSNRGMAYLTKAVIPVLGFRKSPSGWKYHSLVAGANKHTSSVWESDLNHSSLYIPYWFFVILSAVCGSSSWFRFSLRTLLIATTLIAVVMGLIVWLK